MLGSSKLVILNLRVPTVDRSLCLLLCSPSTGHIDVLSVVVVWPVIKFAFSNEFFSPFLCKSIELGADLESGHSVLCSVAVVRSQRVLPELVEVNGVSVQLLAQSLAMCLL